MAVENRPFEDVLLKMGIFHCHVSVNLNLRPKTAKTLLAQSLIMKLHHVCIDVGSKIQGPRGLFQGEILWI